MKSRERRYDHMNGKEHFGSAFLVQSKEDWDSIRRSKMLRCQSCPMYDPLMDGCRKGLLPGECER